MREHVYFGGYTRHSGLGIYQSTLQNNALTHPTLFLNVGNPTYFTTDSPHQRLFTIITKGDQGGVASYDISGSTPQLINQILVPGRSPAYITYDSKTNMLFDANYHKGQANAYAVSDTGILTLRATLTQHGHGPRPEQESAHIHYIDFTPDRRLVVCDLGSDTVTTYDFKDNQFQKVAIFETEPGFGPRHIAFHPTEPTAYVLGEPSSELTILKYNASRGQFTPLNTIALIPENYSGFNGSAALRISKDGRFLYASNRGHNSIAVFEISDGGQQLNLRQHISTYGDGPRDFALNSNEDCLIAANQNTDDITLYHRDALSGRLTVLQKEIPCPEGTCVHFSK